VARDAIALKPGPVQPTVQCRQAPQRSSAGAAHNPWARLGRLVAKNRDIGQCQSMAAGVIVYALNQPTKSGQEV